MKNTFKYLLALMMITSSAMSHTPAMEVLKKAPKEQINKLLIIVLVSNIENRRTLEDELGYTFGDYGVSTVASHGTYLAGPDRLSKENVLAVCEKKGADGVLVVRLVDAKEENSYSYNQRSQYTGAGFTSYNSSGVVYSNGQSYSWGDYAYGNYFDSVKSTKVVVQSDLYHVTDAKQLFTNDAQMRVGEVEEAIGKFAKKLTKKIVKTKYLVTE